MTTRSEFLDQIENTHWDLLVIGGGITGAGVLREAASRGMKALLVEADDFASGTSSRSSKLVHGGIRYLENLDFKLVFEALSERHLLFQIAPHLVKPLRFNLPLYKDSRVGRLKLGLGMWLYDMLALFRTPEMHCYRSVQELKTLIPDLQFSDLLGSFEYSDAYMDDDRLAIDTLRSAEQMGGVPINYMKAGAPTAKGLPLQDQLTGKDYWVQTKHTLVCLGPWTDLWAKGVFPDWRPLMRPTKGIHLVLPKDRLNIQTAVVMPADRDKRIVFAIPRHDMTIVGTTDTDFHGNPGEVRVEKEDVNYVLGILSEYFPGAQVKEEDVLSAYAGVRPLFNDGSETEGKTSREHYIKTQGSYTVVTGGKYTTYRKMAEQAVKETLRCYSIEDQVRFDQSHTKQPLLPEIQANSLGKALEESVNWSPSFPSDQIRYLVSRYGAEAKNIIERYKGLSLWELEAHVAIEKLYCFRLVDFFVRRTPLFLATFDHGISELEKVAAVFQKHLSWSVEQTEKEKQSYLSFIKEQTLWKAPKTNATH